MMMDYHQFGLVLFLGLFQILFVGISAFFVGFQHDEGGKAIWRRRRPTRRCCGMENLDLFFSEYDSIANGSDNFRLPVFPLRKAVKLPSEELTLNLFEERYLEMARYVLHRQRPKLFGALYCSGKTQMVKAAKGPTTPLIEAGDIGTIFLVVEHDEGMIPSLDGSLRLWIRLCGMAIGRFRVDAVLQNGYNSDSTPFILVEASKLEDKIIEAGSEDESLVISLERELQQAITDRCRFHENFLPCSKKEDREQSQSSSNSSNYKFVAKSQYHREIFSFLSLSILNDSDTAPADILKYLQSTSTKERLCFAKLLEQQKKQSWKILL